MEVKPNARRMRVLAAALCLGLVVGIQASGFFSAAPHREESLQSEDESTSSRSSTGFAGELKPGQGISLKSASGSRVQILKPTASQLAKAWSQSTTRLKYLDRCEKTVKCLGFDDSEAWSYDLDVRRQQAAELKDFKQIALAWHESHGGQFPKEAEMVARYFLASGNDDVKEAALDLIDQAPVTPENLKASLGALTGSASGPLMKVLLKSKMISGCSDASMAPMCVAFIQRSMKVGGENLQKVFARYSLDIMNQHTYQTLAQIERRQDPRSTKRLYMRLNREEYQRMQRGG